jgi:3-phenylpropionate/trans-cinnamate dioxygenase ferredoxin subunit
MTITGYAGRKRSFEKARDLWNAGKENEGIMAGYVEVLKANDLKDGQMKAVKTKGQEILLAKVGGKFYAAENTCPHMGGKLAQGKLEGTVVTCPLHASKFELKDGSVVRWTNWPGIVVAATKLIRRPRAIKIYPVKVEGDKVLVEV